MGKSIKVIAVILTSLCLVFMLTACGQKKPDYSAKTAESALNAGNDIEGKTVEFKVKKVVPNSAFGYNMETGKHLNFVSEDIPKVKKGFSNHTVKKGDTVFLKVKKVKSVIGSYVITYSDLSNP